jgi:predicted O-methyltransferase YrrM
MNYAALKSLAKRRLPIPLLVLATRIHHRLLPRPMDLSDRKALATLKSIDHVLTGPFRGMSYGSQSFCSTLGPKLLGTYELEIHHLVEDAIARQPNLIVDVGTAEGYYAVGLAMRLPHARVVGFDIDRVAQTLVAKTAGRNQIGSRLEVRGECSPAILNSVLDTDGNPLIICDCEGYEDILLSPSAVPNLAKASILVELHDFSHRGITERIAQRLAPTHHVQTVTSRLRTAADFPKEARITNPAIDLMNEHRPGAMNWHYAVPRV